jgi:hypothetical protein
MRLESVWIFVGSGGCFPSGVFTDRHLVENWIKTHSLTRVLTLYPTDIGAYDWAIAEGYFKVGRAARSSSEFIQTFSSASQQHFHYEDGVPQHDVI